MKSKFWIKLRNTEFWPSYVHNWPVIFQYIWLSLRARSFFFFSAANPSIYSGGMMGEPKDEIYDLIPDELMPVTVFAKGDTPEDEIVQRVQAAGITYPMIGKPNRGEKGTAVTKLNNEEELRAYVHKFGFLCDFIFQEFISTDFEAAVYYYCFPGESKGNIHSLTLKEFLTFKGDGKSTIRQLIENNPRAVLVQERLLSVHASRLDYVLPAGESMLAEPVGNHARGTKFMNGAHEIDAQLIDTFDKITARIPGVNICRYDLKCTSLEDLKAGRNIKIIEINGVGADPAHIYHPGYPLWKVWRDFTYNWTLIFRVARANHRKGVPYMTLKEAKDGMKAYRTYIAELRKLV